MANDLIDVPTGDAPDQEQVQGLIDSWKGRNYGSVPLNLRTTEPAEIAAVIGNHGGPFHLAVVNSTDQVIFLVADSGVFIGGGVQLENLTVTGFETVGGDLGVAGDLGVGGDTALVGDLNVDGLTHLDSGLSVNGQATVVGNATIQGTLDVNQNTVLHGALTNVLGLLQAFSNASIQGNLTVSGSLSVSGDLAVAGNIVAGGTVHGSNV